MGYCLCILLLNKRETQSYIFLSYLHKMNNWACGDTEQLLHETRKVTYHKLIRLSAVLQKKHLDRYHIHVRRGFSKISPEVSGGVPAKRDLEINFDQDDV